MNILEKVLEFNQIELRNRKVELMTESPFVFFRGTSHLFFEHLHRLAENEPLFHSKELLCWVQGDAHLNNLGFSNIESSTLKRVRFDVNDFDEAYIGNPLLDVVRFGVSIGLYLYELSGGDENLDICYNDTEYIELFLKLYLKSLNKQGLISYPWKKSKFMSKARERALKRAESFHSKSRINKFTEVQEDGKRVFLFDSGELRPIENREKRAISKKLPNLDIVDIVERVSAGVGSAHLKRYYLLVNHNEEEILLEMKEQLAPAYLEFFKEYRSGVKYPAVNGEAS